MLLEENEEFKHILHHRCHCMHFRMQCKIGEEHEIKRSYFFHGFDKLLFTYVFCFFSLYVGGEAGIFFLHISNLVFELSS